MIDGMDPRRLELLLWLSRLGSMREVSERLGVTTSTVSQQVAALAREVGTPLVEPEGRRVRLTTAGRRLADHAVTILASIEAARLDLDPTATPTGVVRVASFATGIRRSLLPTAERLAEEHPDVTLQIHEHEPPEAMALLAADAVDLALTYDYNLAPAAPEPTMTSAPLWTSPWGLGVPSDRGRGRGSAVEVTRRCAEEHWIVNSRNTADGEVLRILGSMAGVVPRVVHEADSLDLVGDLVAAGLGVGMLPVTRTPRPGVRLWRLRDPDVTLRAYAVTRRGRDAWPPLALVRDLVARG